MIPNINVSDVPTSFSTVFRAVAVVLSFAGNHRAEITGGAPKAIGPASPFKSCATLLDLLHNIDVS